jgi:hypothetical protein
MGVPLPFFLLFTYPGAVFHQALRRFFCTLTGTPVRDVCYFQFDVPAGFVQHEPAKTSGADLLIRFGPGIVCTIVGVLVAMPAIVPVQQLGDFRSAADLLFLWVGVSVAMHAFASSAAPPVVLVGLFYGIAVSIGLPLLLIKLLA